MHDSLPLFYLRSIRLRSFKISNISIQHIKQFYSFRFRQSSNILQTFQHRFIFNGQRRLKDHLGNQRVLFSDANGDGSIDVNTEVLQTTAYYPFGMRMEGEDYVQNAGREDRYLYNGKELDTDFGLNLYHYGARMYDVAVGRFTGTDRFAHKFAFQSPYAYAANNPIKFIDVNGDSIKVTDALRKDEKNYRAFQLWAGTKVGKQFLEMYGIGGKYENINVIFDSQKETIGNRGTTSIFAVNNGTGEETELVAENTITRYQLEGRRSSLKKGESLKFILNIDPSNRTKADRLFSFWVTGKDIIRVLRDESREMVSTGLTFLHEAQHIQITTQDILNNRKIIQGAHNQHLMMKNERGKWFRQRFNFLKKFSGHRFNNKTLKRSVNGFELE